MSVSVSSFELFTICTTPTTSSSGATSNCWVATGSGTTGAGGGGGGGGGSECFPWKREHAVTRAHSEAATAARIGEIFMARIMTSVKSWGAIVGVRLQAYQADPEPRLIPPAHRG